MSIELSSINGRYNYYYSAVNNAKGGNSVTDSTPNTFVKLIDYNHRRAAFTLQNKGQAPIDIRLDDVEGQPIFTVGANQYMTLTPSSSISVSSATASVAFAWLEETIRK